MNNPYNHPYNNQFSIPEQYRPISAWGYVGYTFLFSIPLVGFILMIVFAVSNDNINRRNYARSYFCILLIAVIICVILALVMGLSLTNIQEAIQNIRVN